MFTYQAFFAAVLMLANETYCVTKLDMSSPMPRLITRTTPANGQDSKTRIALNALINYGRPLPIGPICTEGMQIALDAIGKSPLLDSYELTVIPFDDMCARQVGVRQMIDTLSGAMDSETSNRLPLILGPLCAAHMYTGTFAEHYNHVEVTAASTIIDVFSKRSLYNSFYVLNPSTETFYEAIPSFLKSNGWSTVFLLSEATSTWDPLEKNLAIHLGKQNISLAGTSKVLSVAGTVPTPEQFEAAVSNIAAMNPRIIIINTSTATYIACWLYRYRLFGPNYVLIIMGATYFLPSAGRPPGCIEQMLFKVLQSVVWFFFNSPVNVDSNAVDSLGVRAGDFDESGKSRLQDPQLNSFWFFWRSFCYDLVASAAVVLNSVEQDLQKSNDTLSNWFTSGENFQTNGSYIHSVMSRKLEQLAYKGLSTNGNSKTNSRNGVTGFFQMQLVENMPNVSMPLSAMLRPVPVASYYSSDGAFIQGPGKYLWRTQDGRPPFDSLKILQIQDSNFGKTADICIKVFAAAILVANIVLFGVNWYKITRSETWAKSLPTVNSLILIGNMLTLAFVIVLPADGFARYINALCMSASFLAVLGFSLTTFSFLAKLEVGNIAARMSRECLVSSNLAIGTSPNITINRKSQNTRLSSRFQRRATERRRRYTAKEMNETLLKNTKIAMIIIPCWALIQTVIMAVWFGNDPLLLKRFDGKLEQSPSEISVAYQHHMTACALGKQDGVSTGFVATLIICYLLVFLRSALLAFYLRKVPNNHVGDLHLIRIACYTTGVVTFLGGAVIAGFFSADPGKLQQAISVLAMIIVATNTTVIFIPKLRCKNNRMVQPIATPDM